MSKAEQFIEGRKVKVVANNSSHNQTIGTILTIAGPLAGYSNYFRVKEIIFNFIDTDLELLVITKGQIKSSIIDLELEIEEMKEKLSFMNKTGVKELDENLFKLYKLVKILESEKLSITDKLEKAHRHLYGNKNVTEFLESMNGVNFDEKPLYFGDDSTISDPIETELVLS